MRKSRPSQIESASRRESPRGLEPQSADGVGLLRYLCFRYAGGRRGSADYNQSLRFLWSLGD